MLKGKSDENDRLSTVIFEVEKQFMWGKERGWITDSEGS